MQSERCSSISRFALRRGNQTTADAAIDHLASPGVLRPSEYSVALIDALVGMGDSIDGASVIEIGTGCGVVLAAAAGMGARTLCGVDIEDIALRSSDDLLRSVGAHDRLELLQGHLWQPVGNRQFDLVLANLPHFPLDGGELPGRLKSWSDGGPDGRRLLDPFLDELAAHLAPGGRAVITHNACVGMPLTRRRVACHDLSARILRTHLLSLSNEKLAQMSKKIRQREIGRGLCSIGPHYFVAMHIVEIRYTRRSN